jgi:asparagine synthase (glutamine-hydrolysing)
MIVALMQERSSRPVCTFTIGYEEASYNEADHARAVATHIGADHTELFVSAADAQAVIPELPSIFSEPFADSSQIPTYLLSKLARRQVTVSLSGDGGDELFGGYNRHLYTHLHWGHLSLIPRSVRGWLPGFMTAVSPDTWDRTVGSLAGRYAVSLGDKIHKAAAVIGSDSIDDLYQRLISTNPDSDHLMREPASYGPFDGWDLAPITGMRATERMMALDAATYLSGDILTKVDRAAMANSLETRMPILDPDVFEFAWSLPIDMKIRGSVTKWPLRELLYRHVPRALINRPKMGFGIPIGAWLRGPLREWGEAMLEEKSIEMNGLFNPAEVQRLWTVHLSGSRNYQHQLWPILMVQAWLKDSLSKENQPR